MNKDLGQNLCQFLTFTHFKPVEGINICSEN